MRLPNGWLDSTLHLSSLRLSRRSYATYDAHDSKLSAEHPENFSKSATIQGAGQIDETVFR